MEVNVRTLCCAPLIHTIVVISKVGKPCSLLDWVSIHGKVDWGYSKVSDNLIDENVVGWNIPHATQLHWGCCSYEFEGFKSATDPVWKLKHSNISNLISFARVFSSLSVEPISCIDAWTTSTNHNVSEVSLACGWLLGKEVIDSRSNWEPSSIDEVTNNIPTLSHSLSIFRAEEHVNCSLGQERIVFADPSSTLHHNRIICSVEVVEKSLSSTVEDYWAREMLVPRVISQ